LGAGVESVLTLGMSGDEIKAMRNRLGLSQAKFAERFALNLETLKGWEAARFKPDQAACVLLEVIASAPDAVDQAVAPTRGVDPR
jgi:putative transcriptional regulator